MAEDFFLSFFGLDEAESTVSKPFFMIPFTFSTQYFFIYVLYIKYVFHVKVTKSMFSDISYPLILILKWYHIL